MTSDKTPSRNEEKAQAMLFLFREAEMTELRVGTQSLCGSRFRLSRMGCRPVEEAGEGEIS